jgi:hypothetical protein
MNFFAIQDDQFLVAKGSVKLALRRSRASFPRLMNNLI